MAKAKKKYFVVWDGIEPGIYASWNECKKHVQNYPGARYMGFESEAEAIEAYNSPAADYIGKNKKQKKEPDPELLKKVGIPNLESLSVDAACSGSPGVMEYRGVYTRTGAEIFKLGPFPEATNNIGEFLALVHGLAFLKKQNSPLPLYTDSKTAMKWVRDKKTATKLERSAKNKEVFDLMERAESWLRNNNYTTSVLKWQTEAWGEIPADFGRK